MNFTDYKNILQKNISTRTLWIIGGLVLALLVFQAGVFVGYRKAAFSYGEGDNFHRMFGEPDIHRGMMGFNGFPPIPGGEFTSAYGVSGTIVKISLPTIIVAGNDKVEKVVVITDDTILRHFRDDIGNKDLKVGDNIIVIGSPNSSSTQIEAKLIRVLPPLVPPGATSSIPKIN